MGRGGKGGGVKGRVGKGRVGKGREGKGRGGEGYFGIAVHSQELRVARVRKEIKFGIVHVFRVICSAAVLVGHEVVDRHSLHVCSALHEATCPHSHESADVAWCDAHTNLARELHALCWASYDARTNRVQFWWLTPLSDSAAFRR